VDQAFLERCVRRPEDVGYFFPRGEDIFGIKVRGFSSIGKFLAERRALRAIRAFNLTHMNRGRNAYQASHCYSLADHILSDPVREVTEIDPSYSGNDQNGFMSPGCTQSRCPRCKERSP
jgi:hypothetical protein